jgi:hypothetical protein
MKKFITQCIILFSAIGLSLYYLHYTWESPRFPKMEDKRINQMKNAISLNKKYDFIITGTSHAWGIDENINNLKGERFNKEGSTLYYDLQKYLFLKSCLNDSAIIILPISYFAFGTDENRTDRGKDNSFENEFYSYLPRTQIYNYSLAKEFRIIKKKCQDIFFSTSTKMFSKKKKSKKPKKIAKAKKEIVQDSTVALKWHTTHIKSHAKIRIKQHIKIGEYSDAAPNIAYLSRLIEDAKKSGYRPIMVTVPYHNEYNNLFQKDWLEKKFYQHIYPIKTKYDIPYLDYSSHGSISKKYELFKDSDHLNRTGMDSFNFIFHEDLRKLNYIE